MRNNNTTHQHDQHDYSTKPKSRETDERQTNDRRSEHGAITMTAGPPFESSRRLPFKQQRTDGHPNRRLGGRGNNKPAGQKSTPPPPAGQQLERQHSRPRFVRLVALLSIACFCSVAVTWSEPYSNIVQKLSTTCHSHHQNYGLLQHLETALSTSSKHGTRSHSLAFSLQITSAYLAITEQGCHASRGSETPD